MNASQAVSSSKGVFGSRSNFIVVMVMILGVFVAILNETLLNVALPQIMSDIGISPGKAQWLSTGYLLVIGVLIPVTAYLMQRFTTRALFLTAMVLFAAGTLVAAVAPDFGWLLLGRGLQASGTGLLFPLLTNVVFSIVALEKRGTAMGTIGIVITFAPAIGPTLSGIVVEHYSWRLLFYGVLPIALFVIGFAFSKLQNVTETTRPKVDVLSLVLSTIGFGGLVFGCSSAGEGDGGWLEPQVLIPLLAGAVSLGLFVWRQLAIREPLLDLRTFQYRIFMLSTPITMIVMMAMFSAMLLLAIFLQRALGYSPLEAGFVMLPGGVLMGIMSPITGRLFDRFGARWLAIIGLALIANSLFQFAFLTPESSYVLIMLLNTLLMLGISMLMMPVMTNALNALPPKLYTHGTAILSTLQQVSGAIGTALLVTIMTVRSDRYLADAGVENEATKLAATMSGMKSAFLLAFALVVVALVLALFLKRAAPTSRSEGDGAGARAQAH